MEPARKLATYEDLLALPGDVKGEIVDGAVVTQPAPLPRHSHVQRAVSSFVGKPFHDDDGFGGPGGWWILLEVDVRLGLHVVRPDLAGWRRERLVDPWDSRPIDARPDWVCEIVSPSNAAADRVTKHRIYAEHEVPFYWIIDPAEGTLEALRLEAGVWVDAGSFDVTDVARIAPFEAIELAVGRLFPPPPKAT